MLLELGYIHQETHCLSGEPRFKKKFQVQINFVCHCCGVPFPKMLIFKTSGGIFKRKQVFLCFLMGLFAPTHAFSEDFWQISLKRSLYVENWRKTTAFFFDFGSRWVLPKFSGAPWDPLGGTHRVPEEELKSELNRKVARNNGLQSQHCWHGLISLTSFLLLSIFTKLKK